MGLVPVMVLFFVPVGHRSEAGHVRRQVQPVVPAVHGAQQLLRQGAEGQDQGQQT